MEVESIPYSVVFSEISYFHYVLFIFRYVLRAFAAFFFSQVAVHLSSQGHHGNVFLGFFPVYLVKPEAHLSLTKTIKTCKKNPKQTIRTHNKVFVCGEEVSLLVAACLICQSNSEK